MFKKLFCILFGLLVFSCINHEYAPSYKWELLKINSNDSFSSRVNFSSGIKDNKIVIFGGFSGDFEFLSDFWVSENGTDWKKISDLGDTYARACHSSVVLDNKLFIIGGDNGINYKRDIWSTDNLLTMNELSNPVPNDYFSAGEGHESVAFKENIWIIGGHYGSELKNDVWKTSDGLNLELVTNDAEFQGRAGHSLVVFEDKLWLIGGNSVNGSKNDVWTSSDGQTWSLVTNTANFEPRYDHTSFTFDNKIWIVAGRGVDSDLNDIWFSKDGIEWTFYETETLFSPRSKHETLLLNNSLYIIGGENNNDYLNDVWKLDL